ncbi:MAG: hypothetical protein JWO38_2057 [Gemmataceae bacterium]|nr:hypothetical protein [Gemmataceae bacterium]
MTRRFAARGLGGGLLTVAVVFAAAGCGSGAKPTGTVTGAVKYNGSPVAGGSVNFISTTGSAALALIDEAGGYKIDSPLEAGEYKVYLLPPIPGQLPPGTKPVPVAKFNVPQKFRDPSSSGVTTTVKAGPNEIPIDLKD